MLSMALEQPRTIEDLIKMLLPRIPYEAKAISVSAKGWHKINFTAPFKSKPVVIANLEGDLSSWFSSPVFPKITISIPKVEAPAITLPPAPSITVPTFTIPFLNESFPYYYSDFAPLQPICELLNAQTKMLYTVQGGCYGRFPNLEGGGINLIIGVLNGVLIEIIASLQSIVDKTKEWAANLQKSFNAQTASLNDSLEQQRKGAETSINTAIADAEKATTEAINKLWSMLGQEGGKIFLAAKTRNVTSISFEVYTPGPCIVHYIASEIK